MVNNPLKASLWMLGTLTSFCLVAISARELGEVVTVFQMMLVKILFNLEPSLGIIVIYNYLSLQLVKTVYLWVQVMVFGSRKI